MDKCSSHPCALGQEFGLWGLGQPGSQPSQGKDVPALAGPSIGAGVQHSEAESTRNQEEYDSGSKAG